MFFFLNKDFTFQSLTRSFRIKRILLSCNIFIHHIHPIFNFNQRKRNQVKKLFRKKGWKNNLNSFFMNERINFEQWNDFFSIKTCAKSGVRALSIVCKDLISKDQKSIKVMLLDICCDVCGIRARKPFKSSCSYIWISSWQKSIYSQNNYTIVQVFLSRPLKIVFQQKAKYQEIHVYRSMHALHFSCFRSHFSLPSLSLSMCVFPWFFRKTVNLI